MNRRSFLKRLGLLAVVPFVPIVALKNLIPNPGIGYKCYRSNAQTLKQLIRIAREHNLVQRHYVPIGKKVCNVISVKARNWDNILSELKPQQQYAHLALLRKGFDNFLVSGVPIIERG